jgi:1,4-alpha-glucan branching enzyme
MHLRRFNRLAEDIAAGGIDEALLGDLEAKDNIFPDIDYSVYGGQ